MAEDIAIPISNLLESASLKENSGETTKGDSKCLETPPCFRNRVVVLRILLPFASV